MITSYSNIISVTTLGFDTDAAAFFARVDAATGVPNSLTSTEKIATNQLVLDLKANSLWTPMKAIYPMVGSSAAACAQNLKSASFPGTFNGGWTFASTGATPNGTSAYMDTGLNGATNLTKTNHHISFYSRTQNTTYSAMNIGAVTTTTTSGESSLSVYYNAVTTKGFLTGLYPTYWASSSITNTLGLHIGSEISSTSTKLYQNSSLLATNTTLNATTMPNCNYYLASVNVAGTTGAFSGHQCAFASIGEGLTDTDATNLTNIVTTFQTTLSRQI